MGLYSQTLGDPDPRLPSGYEKKSMNTVRTELFYLRGRTKAHMLLMVISFLLHLEKSLSTHIGTFSIQLYISSTQPHIPTHSYISLHSSQLHRESLHHSPYIALSTALSHTALSLTGFSHFFLCHSHFSLFSYTKNSGQVWITSLGSWSISWVNNKRQSYSDTNKESHGFSQSRDVTWRASEQCLATHISWETSWRIMLKFRP